MAKELRQVRKEIGLRECPFCGSGMFVAAREMDECILDGGFLFRPKAYKYLIGCSNDECIISFHSANSFPVWDINSSLDDFCEKFNGNVDDCFITPVPVDDDVYGYLEQI